MTIPSKLKTAAGVTNFQATLFHSFSLLRHYKSLVCRIISNAAREIKLQKQSNLVKIYYKFTFFVFQTKMVVFPFFPGTSISRAKQQKGFLLSELHYFHIVIIANSLTCYKTSKKPN